MTSTYFEGEAQANPLAQRGYSRDHRPDCKQVCIALVVWRCGMPLGYEVFAGNRADVTTVEEIVETMERRYIATGPRSPRAAICCGATSTIGATRSCGRRTSN